MNFDLKDIPGKKVTIMGLGLHGGGAASAGFFAENGGIVTVTDLRSAKTLEASIRKLEKYSIRFVLGKHEDNDFSEADLVIKNPGVPSGSPFLGKAKHIETDISIFLQLTKRPIIAITGSKGKSSTASAVYSVLKKVYPDAGLGGNITVSPLTFLNRKSNSPVVLELSSWQLADMRGKKVLTPGISVITNIMHDHQNSYNTFDDYIKDKELIFANQNKNCFTILNYDDAYCERFATGTRGRVLYFSSKQLPVNLEGCWLEGKKGVFRKDNKECRILPEKLSVPGKHNRINLLCAALVLKLTEIDNGIISKGLSMFSGIEHRLEKVDTLKGVTFYNDSAATIPEAVTAAVESMKSPFSLITGGTDKELDFSKLKKVLQKPIHIYLLEGTGTVKIMKLLKTQNIPYSGPFSSLDESVSTAFKEAKEGTTILFSPGCTSFGMFNNEFERGRRFKELVKSLVIKK